MPKQSLASMSVDALLKLKDDVVETLSRRADDLKTQLSRLTGSGAKARGRPRGGSALAGRTVPPKYRGPGGETWAGRGAKPVWLRDALKKGKKLEHFLIDKPTTAKKSKVKRVVKKAKVKKAKVAKKSKQQAAPQPAPATAVA
jgi:DNA-binding protein H-NS